jgi:hypothetical protein
MPLHCTMVDAGRQIGGYPIRQYKPPPSASRSATSLARAGDSADVIARHRIPPHMQKRRAAHRLVSDWSDEETDEPLIADHRNFYKVEKWSRDGQRVERMLFAGNSLDRARAIFFGIVGSVT